MKLQKIYWLILTTKIYSSLLSPKITNYYKCIDIYGFFTIFYTHGIFVTCLEI